MIVEVNMEEFAVMSEPELSVDASEAQTLDNATTVLVKCLKKVNLRYYKKTNKAGAPIMMIYPKNNAPVSERMQYPKGKVLSVFVGIVVADGGLKFRRLVTSPKAGITMFVRDDEVKRA
jgi:hypothetical protein